MEVRFCVLFQMIDFSVKEELSHNAHLQPFSDQFVYISPQELHHEYEQTDEECTNKEHQKTLYDEYI